MIHYRDRATRMNVYYKVNILVWFTQYRLGSSTVAIYALERPRTGMLLSLCGQMAQLPKLALKTWSISGQPLVF